MRAVGSQSTRKQKTACNETSFRCITLQQRNWEHTMGRSPIGKVAMTSTERSRRHRAGLSAQPAATKPGPDRRNEKIAALQRELAQAIKHIAKLRAENTKLKSDIVKLKM